MLKIAMVGGRDYISGFKGVGVSIFPVETIEEAHKAFNDILSGDYVIIFLAEGFAASLEETLIKLREKSFPMVTLIPDTQESLELAKTSLSDNIRKAIGVEDVSV